MPFKQRKRPVRTGGERLFLGPAGRGGHRTYLSPPHAPTPSSAAMLTITETPCGGAELNLALNQVNAEALTSALELL